MREYVATAKTVEEAIQLGCEALSVDRDDLGVSYEILEMPQKTGFLGLKVTPAKVKVTVETADTEPETTPAAPVKRPAEPASAGKNGRYWTAEIVISDADLTTRYTVANTACYYKKGAA